MTLTITTIRAAFFAGTALALTGCAGGDYRDQNVPIETVPAVDLERYQGVWYEIARFPVSFEEGCVGVTAEYALNDDGTVKVTNTCFEGSLDAEPRTASASAEAVDPSGAKLLVDFVPYVPFTSGDYWIGIPNGFAGWILARQPRISKARLDRALEALSRNGYDTNQLTMTPQRGG